MPIFYPNVATLERADDMQTILAAAKVKLFKAPFVPTVSTIDTDLDAEEADYTGYAAGGVAVAAWSEPLLDPVGGASIESGLVQFAVGPAPVLVTNLIGGFWVEKATGELYVIGVFPEPIPMEFVGQGIPLSIKLVEPTGQTV